MAENKNLTAQQRAAYFAAATRQYRQQLPSEQVNRGASTMQFTFPKARLLAHVGLVVEVKAENMAEGVLPHKVLRRIALDLNNGFSPYIVTGEQLYLKNYIRNNHIDNLVEQTDEGYKFYLDMPTVLNDNVPNGLYLLQNDTTNVTLTIDVAADTDLGESAEINLVRVSPYLTTFSVPNVAEAMPDISWVKLVMGKNEQFAGVGQNIIKLQVGMIYRQLIFSIKDAAGNPMPLDKITSNIDIVFNQADNPYSISAEALRFLNTSMYGQPLPEGVYAFDFSTLQGGLAGYAGSRDYIDTGKLTEMWLRFNTSEAGSIDIISETLVKLS